MAELNLERKVQEFIFPCGSVVRGNQSVEQTLFDIRNRDIQERIFYFYVVDGSLLLKGVVSTRALLLAQPHVQISALMDADVIAVQAESTLNDALNLLVNKKLLALPVVDSFGRFLGTINVQLYLKETVNLSQKKIDLFSVLGLSKEKGANSIWKKYKNRMPWILCNMMGGIFCAVISDHFEVVLQKVILLAFFIPLVLTLSESISMQSLTYALQTMMRTPSTHTHSVWNLLLQECYLLLFLAFTSGAVIGCIALLWGDGWLPCLSIALGILFSVTVSGVIGAIVPKILSMIKMDPRFAAGPIVLMFADVITTMIYLSLSSFFLL